MQALLQLDAELRQVFFVQQSVVPHQKQQRIRILWRCWQDRVPYDEARYLRSLTQRGSPLAAQLAA